MKLSIQEKMELRERAHRSMDYMLVKGTNNNTKKKKTPSLFQKQLQLLSGKKLTHKQAKERASIVMLEDKENVINNVDESFWNDYKEEEEVFDDGGADTPSSISNWFGRGDNLVKSTKTTASTTIAVAVPAAVATTTSATASTLSLSTSIINDQFGDTVGFLIVKLGTWVAKLIKFLVTIVLSILYHLVAHLFKTIMSTSTSTSTTASNDGGKDKNDIPMMILVQSPQTAAAPAAPDDGANNIPQKPSSSSHTHTDNYEDYHKYCG